MCAAARHNDHKVSPVFHAWNLPALTTNPSSLAITQVYQDLQQERREYPQNVRFAYRNRLGTLVNREVSIQDLNMRDGLAISVAVIDLTFELTLRHGPSRVMSSPALDMTHEEAYLWASTNPPPVDFVGLRLTPVCIKDFWVMLVEEYGGPEIDR